MSEPTYCDFCQAELELSREFVYQFESLAFVDDESLLEAIRNSSQYHGEPLRLCKSCSESVERNRRDQEESIAATEKDRQTSLLIIKITIVCLIVSIIILTFLSPK